MMYDDFFYSCIYSREDWSDNNNNLNNENILIRGLQILRNISKEVSGYLQLWWLPSYMLSPCNDWVNLDNLFRYPQTMVDDIHGSFFGFYYQTFSATIPFNWSHFFQTNHLILFCFLLLFRRRFPLLFNS